jgi:hypothetical protein
MPHPISVDLYLLVNDDTFVLQTFDAGLHTVNY